MSNLRWNSQGIPSRWLRHNKVRWCGDRCLKARLHWSASASASVFFKYLAFHLLCLHWTASASASFIRVRVRFFSTVHRLYMAFALTCYFVKDADAEADTDADQCKRTFIRLICPYSADTTPDMKGYQKYHATIAVLSLCPGVWSKRLGSKEPE